MSGKHRAPEDPWPSPVYPCTDSRGIVKIRHGKTLPPMVAYVTPVYLEPNHPNNDVVTQVLDINDEYITVRFGENIGNGCFVPLRWRVVAFEWRAYVVAELLGSTALTTWVVILGERLVELGPESRADL